MTSNNGGATAARTRSRSPVRSGSGAGLGSGRSLDVVLATASRAAREAGKLIRQAWHASQTSEVEDTKSNSVDLVTETDRKCEDLVSGIILKDFPSDRIIGEETAGSEKYAPPTDEPTWTIDPIDGTTNFVHRFPQSCVIIGYLENKEVVVGVVYDPVADELFRATKGGGAFLESPARAGGAMRLTAPRVTSLGQALISMEVGYGRDEASVSLVTGGLANLLRGGVRSIRMAGSTGLNMAYVAAGRLSAAFEHGDWERGRGPKIWDVSAGKLIVMEAGGVTRDLFRDGNGELDLMGRSQFSACTPELADAILGALLQKPAAAAATAAGATS